MQELEKIEIALRISDSNCEEKERIESYLCRLSQVEQIYAGRSKTDDYYRGFILTVGKESVLLKD